MLKKPFVLTLTLPVTLVLFALASFYPVESMWGLNHLHFLPQVCTYLFGLLALIPLYLLFGPVPEKLIERTVNKIDDALWGEDILPRLLLVTVCTILFFLFRVKTHLLGDGYTWLAVFGHGESYIHKWTEPGSIVLLRFLQNLFGGYTKHTALVSFQLLSVISGVVFVYNTVAIVGRLGSNASHRLFGLITLLLSGALLLFFGYVEFYPLVWAATAVFVNLSLIYLKEDRLLGMVLLSYAVAVLMHLQALYFLPGIIFLIIQKIKKPKWRRFAYIMFVISAISGVVFATWLYHTKVEFEILILPFFKGRPVAPDFSVFSLPHLYELFNLLFLIFPGVIYITHTWLLHGRKSFREPVPAFLGIMSFGSLLFLILFGAAITMGRDWDVMSLSLFAPFLLCLYQIGQGGFKILNRHLLNYITVVTLITLSFLAVSTGTKPAEDRFYTLLNERSRNGWVIYANYFYFKGDTARYDAIMTELTDRFPDYTRLKEAYTLLENGNYPEAKKIATTLVEKDPYQADFLQIYGNIHGKLRQFEQAEHYYHKALKLSPYQPTIMNELGQLYMAESKYSEAVKVLRKAHWISPERTFITESLALSHIYLQHYDSASTLADTLFMDQTDSPGGHLIKMTVALNLGDDENARFHFKEYLKYGVERSDYNNIKEFYDYLNK